MALSTPAAAEKPSVPAPRELAASLSFDHRKQDMMTFVMSHYEVSVTLHVEPAGAARLELRGSLETKTATLQPGVPGASHPPAAPRQLPVDERWTGQAHGEQDALIVHFDQADGHYRPALAVDVLWRCTPETIAVGETKAAAWVCQTSQSLTMATGPGHPLPSYLQVPMYLALPAVRLRVQAVAHGGANHRSTLDHAGFSHQR